MPTVAEMKKMCKAKGIKGYSKMTKAQLYKKCLGKSPPKKKTQASPKPLTNDDIFFNKSGPPKPLTVGKLILELSKLKPSTQVWIGTNPAGTSYRQARLADSDAYIDREEIKRGVADEVRPKVETEGLEPDYKQVALLMYM